MGLISRKAAIEAIKDPVVKGFAMYALKSVPAVPAVPLDKLCEYLSITCACPPNKEGIQKRCLTAQCALCWKESITKWMEEQDAQADQSGK